MMSAVSRLFRLGPVFNATAVASTGSATSSSIDLRHISRIESVILTPTSVSGTADMKLEFAISHDDSTFGSFDDYTDIIASSVTDFVTDEGVTAISMPTPLARYIKFKLTGVASNPADAIATMYLLCREGA